MPLLSSARVWTYIAASFAVATLAYQLAFRYQFIHLMGVRVMRVDHLTGRTCEVTSNPLGVRDPCDAPTEEQKQNYAISLARSEATSQGVDTTATARYQWQAQDAYEAATDANPDGDDEKATPNPVTAYLLDGNRFDDTYLVCYCDPEGAGWRWEVHIPSRQAFYVNSDKALSERYGIVVSR